MSEKTEEATPKRLREARNKGQVARSRDASSAAILLGATAILAIDGPRILERGAALLRGSLELISHPTDPAAVLDLGLAHGMSMLAPLLVGLVVIAAVTGFLQVGPLLTTEPLKPQLDRINPAKGLKNLFSQRQWVEFLKNAAEDGIDWWGALASSIEIHARRHRTRGTRRTRGG